MKKIIFILISVLIFTSIVQAQLTAKGKYKIYSDYPGVDKILMFNGIDATSEITFNGKVTNISWYKFTDPTNPLTSLSFTSPQENTSFVVPEDNTGYILEVDGVKTTFWVFNYENYLLKNSTVLFVENDPKNQCNGLKINVQSTPIVYESLSGISYTLKRNCTLTYQTQEWVDKEWKPKDISIDVILPIAVIEITEVPIGETQFILNGDQFGEDFNIGSGISAQYSAVAVKCKITTKTTMRSETNEAEFPSETSISGSSPLDVLFQSNAYEPGNKFYNWSLFKNNELIIKRTDVDFRYNFVEAGSYKVLLTVNNDYCSFSDSVTVSVSSSGIQAPNVFTPNGDDINDEFRVGYRSITSFQCWVYNRWGRKVYYWNDPQKGWDGKINGKDAPQGAYFYVIKAYGADFDKNSKPDPTTKKRIGEYYLKGDINLLRGKK